MTKEQKRFIEILKEYHPNHDDSCDNEKCHDHCCNECGVCEFLDYIIEDIEKRNDKND